MGSVADETLTLKLLCDLLHLSTLPCLYLYYLAMWPAAYIAHVGDYCGPHTVQRWVGPAHPILQRRVQVSNKGRRRGFRRPDPLAQMTRGWYVCVDMFMLLRSCFGGRQDSWNSGGGGL